jgi:hypothetical protein
MRFFDRLSLGWEIALNSFKVIKENKQLLLFPVFSGLALLAILATFVAGLFAASSVDIENLPAELDAVLLGSTLLFYFTCYFVILFFNVALIHCTKMYFNGETPTVRAGIAYSVTRIKAILLWAFFAGTVSGVLKIIQENTGWIGRLISGLIGIVWSIATFFVVPVIAYEETDPIKAVKRSSALMRENWGESLGSAFSFGIIKLIAVFGIGMIGWLLSFIHPVVGIIAGGTGLLAVITVLSAAEVIFISAVYHRINGNPVEQFQEQLVQRLFEKK